MGRVSAPFGIKGWIRVQPFTQNVDGLLEYGEWWLATGDGGQSFRVLDASVHGTQLLAHLDGIHDREAAQQLKRRDVCVPRHALPAVAEGQHYWSDLIGLEVVNLAGDSLGRVSGMLETGANQVMVIGGGDKERLVPFVGEVIREVDVEEGRISVDWDKDF